MSALIASLFFCSGETKSLHGRGKNVFAFHCPIRERCRWGGRVRAKTISHTNAVPNYNMNERTSFSAVGSELFLFLPFWFSMLCYHKSNCTWRLENKESIWDPRTITSHLWSSLTKQSFSLCFSFFQPVLSSNMSGSASGYLLSKLLSRTGDKRPNTEVIAGYTIHFQLGALCFYSLVQMV